MGFLEPSVFRLVDRVGGVINSESSGPGIPAVPLRVRPRFFFFSEFSSPGAGRVGEV